jgi:hypothetical protein
MSGRGRSSDGAAAGCQNWQTTRRISALRRVYRRIRRQSLRKAANLRIVGTGGHAGGSAGAYVMSEVGGTQRMASWTRLAASG